MIPCKNYTVSQRAAASSSTQCPVAHAALTGRCSFRSNSRTSMHFDSLRAAGAAAVELHPLHADVAAYYADYAGTSPVLAQLQATQQQHVVEVHLEVHYKACYGSQLAVVGSHTGWLTSAAVPMTCSGAEADIWSVVLSLPYGSDVEYKYVVINQQGGVVRWQEGANNTLCLRGAGLLMHVTDSWAHESRQVHEIGVPVPSQQQQRRRAAGGSSSGRRTPAAASPVLLQNNIACFTPSSSSGAAAAASTDVADSSASGLLQQEQQQVLPPSINRSSSFNPQPQPELDTLSQDVADLASALASALAALGNSGGGSSSSQQDSAAILQGLQQQTNEGVTALPAELLAASFDQGFTDEADVTAALQEQEQLTVAAAAMAAEAEAAVARLQQQQQQRLAPVDVFAIAKQALITPPSAAVPGSLAAAAAAAGAAAAPSSSSSSGRRSPSGSPGSSLASASVDEIAAALLSDDYEEACHCLVDAICSCMDCGDSNSSEPCNLEHLYDEAEQQQQQQGVPAAVAAVAAAPEAAESAAFTAAAAAAAAFDAPPAAAVDDKPTPVEELAATQGFVPEPAVASAGAADANKGLGNGCFTDARGSADARAEAFGGVNRALQQSADLLDSLSDPTHPLVLKADRDLADAKRHMGHLLAA